MKQLKSIPITMPEQVEAMRLIYNDNLDMLSTTPIPYRTSDEQQNWWNENKANLKAHLYESIAKPGETIAFSVLTNRGRFYTPIIAISKSHWGKGYGKEIIIDYIEKAEGPLAGSQLQSNGAICHLNSKIGWQIVGESDQPGGRIDLLYHPGVNSSNEPDETIKEEIIRYLEAKYNQ